MGFPICGESINQVEPGVDMTTRIVLCHLQTESFRLGAASRIPSVVQTLAPFPILNGNRLDLRAFYPVTAVSAANMQEQRVVLQIPHCVLNRPYCRALLGGGFLLQLHATL
jgi:hypothetical protein